jgi:hypothetical protein
MLDVWAIDPNQSYVAFIAAKLGKFSPATIAQTIDQALTDFRPEGGRPPPPADVLASARRVASELTG